MPDQTPPPGAPAPTAEPQPAPPAAAPAAEPATPPTAIPIVRIAEIGSYADAPVTIEGWVHHLTDKGRLQFIQLRDGSGVIQAVAFEKDLPADAFAAARSLTQESAVAATGHVHAEPRAPGGYELRLTNLQVVSLAEPDYPIQPKTHGTGFLMEHRHLWIRAPRQATILRIRATIIRALRDWLDDRGFVNVDTPILTPASVEGTTTLFATDYFGEPAFLTQSGQLYNEATIGALKHVYCFGPTFRAEKSKTRRHLTEFWMIEPEMAFATLEDIMDVEEELVAAVVARVLEVHARDLVEILERDLAPLQAVTAPFPRISYDEAVQRLHAAGFPDFPWGEDLGAPHETALASAFDKPVFVYHYPAKCKAFYMDEVALDSRLSRSVDLLAPEGYGEIIGGGERATDIPLLQRRMAEHGLPEEVYAWYLDLRRFGSVPHSGFGLGLERTVAWICGLEHVRETIAFPRMLERIWP